MKIYLLDKELNAVKIIDFYKSIIWTERYNSEGDFELLVPINNENINLFKRDYYIQNTDSKRLMIIEKIEFSTENNSSLIKLSGRSLESLLRRRLVLSNGQFIASNNFQAQFKNLIEYNIGKFSGAARRIEYLEFDTNSVFPTIIVTSNDSEDKIYENLYDACESLCKKQKQGNTIYEIGFKIEYDKEEEKPFRMSLYIGKDRSYDNTDNNPYVIFSNDYDNVVSSRYEEDITDFKNVSYGEQNATPKFIMLAHNPSNSEPIGINRREYKTSITQNESGSQIALNSFKKKVFEELMTMDTKITFDGEVIPDVNFIIKKDYDLGDIVQYVFRYGDVKKEVKARITEIIYNHDENGYNVYPTFSIINNLEGD